MNTSHFRKVSEIKDKNARIEISRAHAMIALLGIVVIVLLTLLASAVALPSLLFTIAVALMMLVVMFSTAVAVLALKMPVKRK